MKFIEGMHICKSNNGKIKINHNRKFIWVIPKIVKIKYW